MHQGSSSVVYIFHKGIIDFKRKSTFEVLCHLIKYIRHVCF